MEASHVQCVPSPVRILSETIHELRLPTEGLYFRDLWPQSVSGIGLPAFDLPNQSQLNHSFQLPLLATRASSEDCLRAR